MKLVLGEVARRVLFFLPVLGHLRFSDEGPVGDVLGRVDPGPLVRAGSSTSPYTALIRDLAGLRRLWRGGQERHMALDPLIARGRRR